MKVFVCIISAILAAALLLWISFQFVFEGCSDTIAGSYSSPDARTVVTVFYRECGATAAVSTQINIQPAYKRFNPRKGMIVAVMEGRIPVSSSWNGSEEVVLSYPDVELFKKESIWNTIRIIHENDVSRSK